MQTSRWILAFVTALGCNGDSETVAGWRTTVDTLATGTVLVMNEPGEHSGVDGVLREELRVGTVDGGGPSSFGGLKGIAVLETGGFAVLDAVAQELRVFDATGEHIATHGGSGRGPGELEGAFGLMRHPNGDLGSLRAEMEGCPSSIRTAATSVRIHYSFSCGASSGGVQ